MKRIMIAAALLLLVGLSMQMTVSPLWQDRTVQLEDDVINSLKMFHKSEILKLNLPTSEANKLPMCKPGHPDFMKFLGVTVATLTPQNPTAVKDTPCYKQTTYSLEWKDSRTAKVTFKNGLKKGLTCADHYLATTLLSFDLHTNWMWIQSTITYKFKTDEEAQLAKSQGIKIILMCDNWLNMIPDIIKTVTLFLPDILSAKHIVLPDFLKNYLNKRAYNFIQRYTGTTLKPRKQNVAITEEYIRKYIKSGDILSVRGPAGLGVSIFYATGGPVSHTAIAMWDDQLPNKLWILEANPAGLLRMELEDWYKAYNYDVAWLHLSDANRAKFNPSKAWKWFRSVENLEYGSHNFIYSLIDDPLHNFDFITDINSAVIMFNLLDMVVKGSTDLFITGALNKRLGTEGLTFSQVLYEIDRRKTNLVDVLKIPEKDGWLYNGKQSFICSAMAIKILQEGGLFAGLAINSHEFTPRDVFMTQLYETDANKMPDLCKQNDPGLPYCQMKGAYLIDPKLYNTIKPYNNMNEKCPSMPPDWFRPLNC